MEVVIAHEPECDLCANPKGDVYRVEGRRPDKTHWLLCMGCLQAMILKVVALLNVLPFVLAAVIAIDLI